MIMNVCNEVSFVEPKLKSLLKLSRLLGKVSTNKKKHEVTFRFCCKKNWAEESFFLLFFIFQNCHGSLHSEWTCVYYTCNELKMEVGEVDNEVFIRCVMNQRSLDA